MGKLNGTHVIAKIVTPDDQDTYATHDVNLGEGGFHQKKTFEDMLKITKERRKAGMECRVMDDPDKDKNGKYVLQNDLETWKKETLVQSTLLGTPPDDGWGKGKGTIHALTTVQTGDTIEQRWDKLLDFLEKIAPELPPSLTATEILLPQTWPAYEQGHGQPTLRKIVQSSVTPVGATSTSFGDSKAGKITALVNGKEVGAHVFTPDKAGSDNGSYGDLTLKEESVFNKIYQIIKATLTTPDPLALNNVKHTYRLTHEKAATEVVFYIDDPVEPYVDDAELDGDGTGNYFVSGVPALKQGDRLLPSFTLGNVVSWYYNAQYIGRIESAYTGTVNTVSPPELKRGKSVSFTKLTTVIRKGVYTENAMVTVLAYNSRALSKAEKQGDVGQKRVQRSSGKIRIDSISDESKTRSSAVGQFPVTGPGGAGEAFNASEDLTTPGNEELMMIGGEVRYPMGDYTHNTPQRGPDYSKLSGGSYRGIRWRTFEKERIENQNSVSFTIQSPKGFNGSPIESGTYALYIKVVGATGWLDGNAAYPGVGNPLKDGDAALDAAQSTREVKRITFGTTPRTGRVLIRIGWAGNEKRTLKGIV